MSWYYNDQMPVSFLDKVKVIQNNDLALRKVGVKPKNAFGFIYIIINKKTNQFYIGKKQCYTKGKYKRINSETKRKHTVEKLYENKWQEYESSSDIVHRWNAKDKKKIIIEWCNSKKELTYKEIKYQMCFEVLENIYSVNENISGKFLFGLYNNPELSKRDLKLRQKLINQDEH